MTQDLGADLAGVLSEHLGRPVTVSGLKRLAGGSSHETWGFDAMDASLEEIPLVLRREFHSGMLDTDVAAEFILLRTLFDAGVPVPEPWLFVTTDSALGTPFMVMERAAGTDLRKDLARPDCDRDLLALATQAVEVIARIHAVPATTLNLDAQWGPAHEIGRWTAVIEAAKPDLDPLLATALTWLGCHLPPAVAAVLVHADFKANNLLISPEGRLTVIDWELAHPGDPVEDLAWTMLWRTQWDVVGGLHTAEGYVAAYTSLTGRQVNSEVLRFWRVFSLVKLWAMFLQGMATENVRPQLRMLGRATVWLADQVATELLEDP
ncbi:phosphotransferase family protein [Sporichthya sp.]|uniref:phosphotransferase family protein n=1 Tax=Sporichthya sp. TaxID=65475 RepID=UPI0017AAC8C0|nr:phosphotransferase family protein [Sporichthya sp.]MBA3743702.1 phosphotransferase family protein [Sporichthya sp.]